MRLRRGRTANARRAALAFAVLAGTLGGVPAAVAAPPAPGTATSPASDATGADGLSVWPHPHSLRANGAAVEVTDEVALVTGEAADPYAVRAVRELLREAGARRFSAPGAQVPEGALVVRVGRERAPDDPRHALPAGGYALTVGRGTVSLAGADGAGQFHAVQTLRQLLRPDGTIAAAVVRDWPATAVRGVTEGFYGPAWTHRQRLAQLDFLGRTKQNRYLYAPGEDLLRQARWREPYPERRRAEFRELAERARGNHVTLGWAVAPGQAMCFASDDDLRALTRKLDAMWTLGFRAFQLQFQDVSYSEWHCGADADRFGSGPGAAARAQAHVANAVSRHLAARHPDAAALSLMPTEYYEEGSTAYRRALARALDAGVEVAWTGVGVVPRTITGGQLAEARRVFGHPLVTMDNYPVNDYAPGRLFLGPYQGREPAVAAGSAGLLANAMEQPEASRIPLFTAADFAWNPRDYRPQESWRAAIADLAGGDARREADLTALAGNTASSELGGRESAYLRPLMKEFWRTRATTRGTDETAESVRLRTAFTALRRLPERLSGTTLGTEVAPWTERLAHYGDAGTTALDMLRAQRAGDAGAAWAAYRRLGALREEAGSARVTVGEGVLEPFLSRAQEAYRSWAGIDHEPPARTGGDHALDLPDARALDAVTVLTEPGTEGVVEARVPGEGWRRLGALSERGATELRADGLRIDAVRVTGADPARVRHLVPWFADESASLTLPDGRADADIGATRRLTLTLGSLRPEEVRGRLTAEAPKGIDVRVPDKTLTVARGTPRKVTVEVTVKRDTPARSYDVRFAFGGATRTLTVHAVPPTAGPDLARSGRASSSADETPDFPPTGANDGDAGTRWSSPAEDDAWWQVDLKRPERLGKVALHWQDAYASAYRVQVSADGRNWRTAAEIHNGRGGRETVRMDEPDVRHIRVQGEKRATRFGYSLWSVEAYAVAD
ncbi:MULTISPECIES: beta-N-acetylglucosaminidase domain-containing protein [unclassified Streptomyces]|uniref:beta-N-acetylglucosaminidase domain-containing protein n=1 Tax=unclassified Streptomyces TaxID=2593676 RepID=UPI000F6BB043|nr:MULTISPECIES: beta-N-acetylglucosaminidase domain-containing protein [unclassified Streptomyces]AZM62276.1 hyaluronidase [Streptomyces sp. WAC 01438]RSM96295.1 hyaluronidase [Streptomyces sp. WAC 01420]